MRVVTALVLTIASVSAGSNFNCKPQGDGFYAVGCAGKYIQCHRGQPLQFKCPGELLFNPDNARCDYEFNVGLCKNKDLTRNVIVKAREPFDCTKRKDGLYGMGFCSTTYYNCHRKVASEMPCPPGLYYRSSLKRCDFRDNVEECNRSKVGYTGPKFSCAGKEDGTYQVAPCVNTFADCSGGYVTYQNCVAGLVYDSKTASCVHKEDCVKPKPLFTCVGKENGFYGSGECSTKFYYCWDGQSIVMPCPPDLYYSEAKQDCVFKADAEECNPKVDSPPSPRSPVP